MNFEYYLKLQKSGDLINAEKGYKLLIKKKNIVNNLFAWLGLIFVKQIGIILFNDIESTILKNLE